MLRELFWEFDEMSKLYTFDNVIFIFRLLISLLIFDNSADFDGWSKLINRKEKYNTFLEIPEINLKI